MDTQLSTHVKKKDKTKYSQTKNAFSPQKKSLHFFYFIFPNRFSLLRYCHIKIYLRDGERNIRGRRGRKHQSACEWGHALEICQPSPLSRIGNGKLVLTSSSSQFTLFLFPFFIISWRYDTMENVMQYGAISDFCHDYICDTFCC